MAISGKEIQNIGTIAVKEFRDNLKSKRFIIIGVFYFGISLLIALAVILMNHYSASYGAIKPTLYFDILVTMNVILALLAILVSADTISLEKKDRTLYQLLSKPVDRSSVILGKFLGCMGVVAGLFSASTIIAYLLTIILTGKYPSAGDLVLVLGAIISMVLVLAAYVALGVLISTITKNPYISMLCSIIVWIGLWFSSVFGNMLGYNLATGGALISSKTFNDYPIYTKIMVWIDPLSHDITTPLLNPSIDQTAAGMPLWANIVFVLVYAAVLLIIAIMLFEYEDLSA